MLSTEFHWVLDRIVKPLYSSSGKGNRQREVGLIGQEPYTDQTTYRITDGTTVGSQIGTRIRSLIGSPFISYSALKDREKNLS